MTEVPTWVLILIGVISPTFTLVIGATSTWLARKGANESLGEAKLTRQATRESAEATRESTERALEITNSFAASTLQSTREIAADQVRQSNSDRAVKWADVAVKLLMAPDPELVSRGDKFISRLMTLPDEVLSSEEKDVLLALMTNTVIEAGGYPEDHDDNDGTEEEVSG